MPKSSLADLPPAVAKHFKSFTPPQQAKLFQVRECMMKLVPDYAEETINYGMPAFRFDKKALWYAGWVHHYSVYFVPQIMEQFKTELKKFKTTKSAVNIPWEAAVPVELITKMTKVLVSQPGFYKQAANITKKPVGKLKVCKQGHEFYKSSDCPVCPICEKGIKPEGFLGMLSAPARRALEKAGFTTLKKLAKTSPKELLKLHGFGPATVPVLKKALQEKGLSFKGIITSDPYTHFHKDGTVWAKGQTVRGVQEGYWEWFRKDGVKMRSGYFKKGKQVGEWTTYDARGKKYKVTDISAKSKG